MLANIPRLQAMKLLDDHDYSGKLNSEQLFDLVLRATNDDNKASEWASQRGLERMAQGLPA